MKTAAANRLSCALCALVFGVAGELTAQGPPAVSVGAPAEATAATIEPLAIPLTIEFTYQGVLKSGGVPVTGTCDLTFRLYDQLSAGTLLQSITWAAQPVSGGLFTVPLSFGTPSAFTGDARWLEIAAACPAGATATTLTPRQKLTAVPFALTLRPGANISAATAGSLLSVTNTLAGSGSAATFENAAEYGWAAVTGTNGSGAMGVLGTSTDGVGVQGTHLAATGAAAGVQGLTNSTAATAVGVRGEISPTNPGSDSAGVKGVNNSVGGAGYGVWGQHSGSGYGVYGSSTSGTGVRGHASGSGAAVYGDGTGAATGVYAHSETGKAIHAYTNGSGINNPAVYAQNGDTGAEPAGIAIYAKNASGDATIVAHNTSTGDVFRALNAAGNAFIFRITSGGTVRADGSYNCGLSSGCFNSGSGADLAERIDAAEEMGPGDVVEIVPETTARYRRTRAARSPLVAGVISTAPAMTMNNDDLAGVADERTDTRPLIALVGVVPVKASAESGPIRPGDLLVSAGTAGHAMRAGDAPATGTVIGKALSPLAAGTGTVSMLVMLR